MKGHYYKRDCKCEVEDCTCKWTLLLIMGLTLKLVEGVRNLREVSAPNMRLKWLHWPSYLK